MQIGYFPRFILYNASSASPTFAHYRSIRFIALHNESHEHFPYLKSSGCRSGQLAGQVCHTWIEENKLIIWHTYIISGCCFSDGFRAIMLSIEKKSISYKLYLMIFHRLVFKDLLGGTLKKNARFHVLCNALNL